MSHIVTTAPLPDGNVAVLVMWSGSARRDQYEWDLVVATLASTGYTEGLDIDDAVLLIEDRAELYVASKPVQAAPVTVADKVTWDKDPHFMRLLDQVCDTTYAGSQQ